jgi:hypothetical protein
LSKEEIFEAVDRFYRAYYLRAKPILRIIKTMLEDKDIFVRRCREGFEFFRSLKQRQNDLEASKSPAAASVPSRRLNSPAGLEFHSGRAILKS